MTNYTKRSARTVNLYPVNGVNLHNSVCGFYHSSNSVTGFGYSIGVLLGHLIFHCGRSSGSNNVLHAALIPYKYYHIIGYAHTLGESQEILFDIQMDIQIDDPLFYDEVLEFQVILELKMVVDHPLCNKKQEVMKRLIIVLKARQKELTLLYELNLSYYRNILDLDGKSIVHMEEPNLVESSVRELDSNNYIEGDNMRISCNLI